MAKSRIVKVLVGRLLNHLFHANLELCSDCGRYTTWDEERLVADWMYCPACSTRFWASLDAYEREHGVPGLASEDAP